MIDIKRSVLWFCAVVLLAIGVSAGFVLRDCFPVKPVFAPVSSARPDNSAAWSESDNLSLLSTALSVLDTLKKDDLSAFSSYIHPDYGVRFTPASTVSNTDLVFSSQDFSDAAKDSSARFIWGVSTDDNTPIRLSILDYFHTYVWDADYTAAPEIGVDSVLYTGNAVENVSSASVYPENYRFLDFYIPSTNDHHPDWSALKLVFSRSTEKNRWYLIGVIHSGWTP